MQKPLELLLVEDNAGDVELIQIAFERAKFDCRVTVSDDGQKALDYLHNLGSDSVRPEIILLDLNLPKRSGQEVLQAIKSDPQLASIPVIVFTTAASPSLMTHASQYPKTLCYTKPFE